MIDDELQAARGLIKKRNYAAARAVLLTIPDDPTARRWLKRLDETRPAKRRLPTVRLILVTVVIAVVFVAAQMYRINEYGTALARTIGYCQDLYRQTPGFYTAERLISCSDWALGAAKDSHRDQLIACHQQSPTLDAGFAACMAAEGIFPPGIIR